MTEKTTHATETFYLYDLQAEKKSALVDEMSLNAIRVWLVNLWDENPDEEMTKEEHNEMVEEIIQSDYEELNRRLSGVGYYMEPTVKS